VYLHAEVEEILVKSRRTSFVNERMLDSTETPAQSDPAFNSAY